jgi:hypothetical protein
VVTLELNPKDHRGSTHGHSRVKVWSYERSNEGEGVPTMVSVAIQDKDMLTGVLLDEEETGRLIKGLRDALEVSKAIAASQERQEAGRNG